MHAIKMSVSQLIIVGFEKLKRQNVHQHLLYTLRGGEGVTKKRAFCTLELNVDIFGWSLKRPLEWKETYFNPVKYPIRAVPFYMLWGERVTAHLTPHNYSFESVRISFFCC